MRLFDVTGIVFVSVWIGIVGAFVIVGQEDGKSSGIPLVGGEFELYEDTTWMTVYREGNEVGVLREDRTLLIDGWLIETQGIVQLNLMDDSYYFNFTSRSTLNEELILRSATGEVKAFGMELSMNGRLHHNEGRPELHVNVNLDDSSQQFIAELDQAPRLAAHAIPQMLASEELEEGVRFQQEFFDPLTLSPSTLEMIYEGRDEVTNIDGDYPDAHAFRQSVGGFVSEIRADSRGMVIQQTLPMQVAIARLPEALGRNQFHDYSEAFEEASEKSPPFIRAIDTEDLLALVSRFGSGQVDRLRPVGEGEAILKDEAEDEPSRGFEIAPLPAPEYRDLMSPRQHVAIQTSEHARIEVGTANPLWHAGLAPQNSSYTPVTTPDDHESVADLADALGEIIDTGTTQLDSASLREIATLSTEYCADDLLELALRDVGIPWPSILDSQPATPLECLALLADALAARSLPPHFVHGAVAEGDHFAPRIWLALYHDGEFIGSLDIFAPDGQVGSNHVQLYVDDVYDAGPLDELSRSIAAL